MADLSLRWGIAGTGTVSQQIASDLQLTENATIGAVCSRSHESADTFADRFDIPGRHTDFADLVTDPDIDVIYIGTPHVTHHALAKQAMEAGKHVLCEKPIALDSPQLHDLVATARATGVFFMEAMWMKFNPGIRRVQAMIDAGTIGEVRGVRASFGLPFPEDESSRWKADMFGSALLDQGIYPVTLAEMLLGTPDSVQVHGLVREDGVDLGEYVTLSYADGRSAQLASSMVEFIDPSASINGTRGWITIPPMFWVSTGFTVHKPTMTNFMAEESTDFPREGWGYVPMLRAVAEAIGDGLQEHPLHTWADSTRVFAILDAIRLQLTR